MPARFALAAATLVVLCLAGWWWLSRPALLPSTVVGGIDPGTTAPVLSAAAVLVPAPSSAEQPQPRPVRTATASLPAAPVQSARAQTSDEEYSLPPLPEPPETQFDDVAPAPLLVARLDEPAPIEIKPLVFAPDPPDDNGAGDSRW